MSARDLLNMFRENDGGAEDAEDHYSVEFALKEIECYISYLEDTPEELLIAHNERFDRIRERLGKLDEYLHDRLKKVA